MGHMGIVGFVIIAIYFGAMTFMGWFFARRAKNTEQYFVAGRNYPGWLIGVSLFGAAISSITFVAYPADAYKTAYLRYLICLVLPVGVFIASRFFLPFFRRGRITSVFEYLEGRYGPATRLYGATVFILAQCIRISLIQYLVSILINQLTGWDIVLCILLGGAVTAYYTVAGGMEAVIWTDFVQSLLLTAGGVIILAWVVWKLPSGFAQLVSVARADGKFMFGDLDPGDGKLHAASWAFALDKKTIPMLLLLGLFQWLAEYSTNQEVIQKYCASKSAKDARRAMWICCWTCVPTWGYFMFIGTGLYVFYKVFPDPQAAAMLAGTRKAEEILPYFITTQFPAALSGIVAAAVLAAAMSSMSSAMNSISAVTITDVYRRHLAKGRTEQHYMRAARLVTLFSAFIMIAGAYLLSQAQTKTLQHTAVELAAIIMGGLLGLYMLGFFTTRGDGRAAAVGILFAVCFSAVISFAGLEWFPTSWNVYINTHFDTYYTGLAGNIGMFAIGFLVALFIPARHRDLTNLTVWTQDGKPLD